MKWLIIVLSVVSTATASLEPVGYKPPVSSSPTSVGRERYLPPSYTAVASPRGVLTPETHYLPPNHQSLPQNVIPNSLYLPSNQQQQHPATSINSHNSVSPSSVGLLSEHYLPPPPASGPSHRVVTSQYHQHASSAVRDRGSISHHVSSNSAQAVATQHTANRNVVSSQYLPPLSTSQQPTETFDHHHHHPLPPSTYLPANQNQYQEIQPPASILPSNSYLTPNKFSNTSPGGFSGSHYEHSHSTTSSNSHLNPASLSQPAGHYYSNSGHSTGGYTYDQPPAKYQFDYHVNDEYGNDYSHKETRDGENTQGVYTVLLPDGRKQIVHYLADRNGYRPTITYENPQSGKSGYNQGYQY